MIKCVSPAVDFIIMSITTSTYTGLFKAILLKKEQNPALLRSGTGIQVCDATNF